jgi:hypothetical protein
MTIGQLHAVSTQPKIVNITALYQTHHCSILEVFNHLMNIAIKDLKLGENDFEKRKIF